VFQIFDVANLANSTKSSDYHPQQASMT